MTDNRALWELVEKWRSADYIGTSKRAREFLEIGRRHADELAAILERPVVVGGWVFYYADDEGSPYAAYCASRDDVYREVAVWMCGEFPVGEVLSDSGDDMVEGVTETLLEHGAFHPEGDPPCYLREALESMVRGKS